MTTRALYVCNFNAELGRPDLPNDDDIIGGVAGYGWVTVSYTPTDSTCVVEVNTSDEMTTSLKDSETVIWITDLT